ncbi:MAG: M16 family metallopeptidase [Desulfobacterales bacterium]
MRRIALVWLATAVIALLPVLSSAGDQEKSAEHALRATLENGLRVVIVPNRIAPVVTTVLNYLVGSNEAPDGYPGMAHAQEHMMFRGSPNLTAGQLANITAAMGGRFNADTQQTVTQYFLTVPTEDLDVALHVEAIRMRGVLDSQTLWAQERGAIEQEVAQDLSNPQYVFYTRLLAAMFNGTPYAHDALGTRSSFDKTTGAMLKKFHDTWYAPNNAVLVIAGDVEPAKTLTQVKRLFGGIPAKKLPKKKSIHLKPVKPQTIELNSDLPYGLAIIAFRMPGYDSPDYAASQILADVLNSRRGRLYNLVTEDKALDTGFSLDTLPAVGMGYVLGVFPKGGDSRKLLGDLRRVVSDELKAGFPADLVEAAKRREQADAEFQKNSVAGLAMAWSDAVAVEGRQSPQDDLQAIARVTPADVDQAARRYLDPDQAISAILTPESSGSPVTAKGFGGKESFNLPQTRNVQLPDWAATSLSRITVPDSTLHPTVSILPNGLKLIVQPESVSNTVSVYGYIDNNADMQVPKGKEGVDQVLDQLFSYGTETRDRLAFQKALDDIAADVSAGTNFSLRVLAERFEQGTALLADDELHPALPRKAFETVRNQTAATVAGRLQSPDYLTERALKKALFPKTDPTLRHATPQTVSGLSLKDVREYYRSVFRPDETVIVVIGNVTPERAAAVIGRHFGEWRAVGSKPNVLLPPVPPNRSSTVTVPDASRVQDTVTLAETVAMTRSNPDYYALRLGDHVLGGGFYATRLYQDLREKSGLVYYVGVGLQAGRTRAVYEIEYACDPPNVARTRTIVAQNLRNMQNQAVGTEELRRARAMLLREIPLEESSLSSIAQGFITRTKLDLPLDEPTQAARKYVSLSAEEVKTVFAKWLRPDALVQVTQGPAPH